MASSSPSSSAAATAPAAAAPSRPSPLYVSVRCTQLCQLPSHLPVVCTRCGYTSPVAIGTAILQLVSLIEQTNMVVPKIVDVNDSRIINHVRIIMISITTLHDLITAHIDTDGTQPRHRLMRWLREYLPVSYYVFHRYNVLGHDHTLTILRAMVEQLSIGGCSLHDASSLYSSIWHACVTTLAKKSLHKAIGSELMRYIISFGVPFDIGRYTRDPPVVNNILDTLLARNISHDVVEWFSSCGAQPYDITHITHVISDDERIWRSQLTTGAHVHARDSEYIWYQAVVVSAGATSVMVHYYGFNPKWNEWIDRTSLRLMPPDRCKQINVTFTIPTITISNIHSPATSGTIPNTVTSSLQQQQCYHAPAVLSYAPHLPKGTTAHARAIVKDGIRDATNDGHGVPAAVAVHHTDNTRPSYAASMHRGHMIWCKRHEIWINDVTMTTQLLSPLVQMVYEYHGHFINSPVDHVS